MHLKSLQRHLHIPVSAIICFLFIKPSFIHAQQNIFPVHNLSAIQPDWYIVTGGNPLCEPVKTSYGSAVLTEGKIITSLTPEGNIKWQRSYSFYVKPYLSAGLSDILFLVTGKDGKTLTLLNPTGGIIRHIENTFEITSAPVHGKDGRIFVYGTDKAACYGLNGICKWIYQFDSELDPDLKPIELNDGSQLFFLSRTIDGKSTGIRLSAFGQVFENITFSAQIKNYSQCKNGIMLQFTDGSAGYAKVEKNTLESKWIFESKNNINSICGNTISENPCVFTSDNSRLNFIREKDGSIISSIKLEGYSQEQMQITECADGTFVSNSKKGTFISNITSNERIVYEYTFDKTKNYIYIIPPEDGNIIFLSKDWSIKGWKLKQTIGNRKNKTMPAKASSYFDIEQKIRKRQIAELSSSWATGAAADDKLLSQMTKAYTQGFYGEKEYDYHSLLKAELTAIEDEYTHETKNHVSEVTYFKSHASYTEKIITLSSLTGTALFQKNISFLLRQTKDSSLYRILLNAAKNISFDENYSILNAIYVSLRNFSPDDEGVYLCVCDAVLSICQFMGQDAFNSYGREILESLRYSAYTSRIQQYAEETLSKIVMLKI